MGQALRDLGGVFADGVRVLAAHWPQMVGIFLIGATVRMGVLWGAIEVSNHSPLAAVLMLPLAPLATLVSLVLMLRVTAETLPAFHDVFASMDRRERLRSNLAVAGQVIIPFLAVYSTQGLLTEDVHTWLFDTGVDEWFNEARPDFTRADYASGWGLVALVVGALVLRKLITVFGLTQRSLWLAFAAAYLEVTWLITLARSFETQLESWIEWVTSRKVINGLFNLWEGFLDALGQWAAFITVPLGWLASLLGQLGDLVIVPVAWLAIGASIYGAELAQARALTPDERLKRRLERVPGPVRKAVAQAAEPITSPIKEAATALGKIASAGLVPMVLFCVVFVVAGQLKVGVAALIRLVIGPRDYLLLYALTPHAMLLERLVYFTVSLVLVAAAVNRVVLSTRAQAAAASEEAAAPASAGVGVSD